ncbi:TPA: hypothetical protein ACVFCV_001283 [Streptococcus pyogenes]|nr:hypothetical protein [Streptococcus pyogenes]HER5331824.1 hypothetical protein [Streptococcus pyogenes]HER5335397.1 hypothetical protein [Streptococcus pyogenes]HER5339491.1 hypothetical protein [Streptococcus pyogenes]HER5346279.1 hypothetical protein [Streptococcus pyogenes]
MKTKSKRFLKLATLCLALLSTTLLVTQPVKAEVVLTQSSAGGSNGSEKNSEQQRDILKKRYMDRTNASLEELEQESDRNRFEGYFNGYNDGLNGLERPERDNIDVPSGYGDGNGDGNGDVEYRDGYQEGFEEGRHEGYPVTAFLEDLWGFLTDIFGNWFGSNNSSQ